MKDLSRIIFIAFLFLFVLCPLFIIVGYSITDQNWHFSLTNFSVIFTHKDYLDILERSIRIALKTTLISILIAYPVAYFIATTSKKNRNTLIVLLVAPIWTNFVLRTYAWVKILGQNGILNNILGFLGVSPIQFLYNEKAVVFGMVYNLLPFMILSIYNALIKIDKSYLDAASDLGSSNMYTFRKIIFPLSLVGVKTGVLMVFIPAITLFAVSDILGGVKNMLIGNLVSQSFFIMMNWHLGASIGLILILFIVMLGALLNIRLLFHKRRQQEWHFE